MDRNIQKMFKRVWDDETGAVLIVEASYVFPITFFILFFLIYFGNLLYIKTAIASYVSDAVMQGAAYCANPWLRTIEQSGAVPTEISDIKPYRGLNVFGGCSDYETEIQTKVKDKITKLGGGFFYGMNAQNVVCTAKYQNYVVMADFSVQVTCKIIFPMNFLGEDTPWGFTISAYEKAPVMEACEFIRNVDMGLDYIDRSETAQEAITAVKDLFDKAKTTFHKFFGGS